MSARAYEFYAGMTCDGCSGAITRILNKVDGVTGVECDVDAKKLVVRGSATKEVIEEKLAKWSAASGKEVRFVKEL